MDTNKGKGLAVDNEMGGGSSSDESLVANWIVDIESRRDKNILSQEELLWKTASIYKVPGYKRELNPRAFTPMFVSFGPFHYDTPELKKMEVHKERALVHFLERINQSLQNVKLEVAKIITELRDAYYCLDDPWKTKDDEFLKIMILDGCFTLEILQKLDEVHKGICDERGYFNTDPYFSLHGIFYKCSYIRRDMLLIENQLPLILFKTLVHFQTLNAKDKSDINGYINRLVLNLVAEDGYKTANTTLGLHALDLFRSSLLSHSVDKPQQTHGPSLSYLIPCLNFRPFNNICQSKRSQTQSEQLQTQTVPPETQSEQLQTSLKTHSEPQTQSKNEQTQSELPQTLQHQPEQAQPLQIQAEPEVTLFDPPKNIQTQSEPTQSPQIQSEPPKTQEARTEEKTQSEINVIRCAVELKEAGVRFKRSETSSLKNIKFNSITGKFHLPFLIVDDATECSLLNVITFEYLHVNMVPHVTTYVTVMDEIIDTANDVRLLHRKGLILSSLGNDEEVADIFNRIGKEITMHHDEHLEEVKKNVSDYCKRRIHRWRAHLINKYFRNPWTAISLAGALLIIALTIAQTVYSSRQK